MRPSLRPTRARKPHPAPNLAQAQADFTAEGAPLPGLVATEPPVTAATPAGRPKPAATGAKKPSDRP